MHWAALSFLFCFLATEAIADLWVDKDGGSVIRIDERSVSFFSVGDEYYFDQIFTNVREDSSNVSICFGFQHPAGGRPDACFRNLTATPAFQSNGEVRALHVNTELELFFTILIQGQLREGSTLLVSIDDGDLFRLFTIAGHNKLTPDAKRILSLDTDSYGKSDRIENRFPNYQAL